MNGWDRESESDRERESEKTEEKKRDVNIAVIRSHYMRSSSWRIDGNAFGWGTLKKHICAHTVPAVHKIHTIVYTTLMYLPDKLSVHIRRESVIEL